MSLRYATVLTSGSRAAPMIAASARLLARILLCVLIIRSFHVAVSLPQMLSMMEGLGKKYGAPRRNVQEKIRSQAGWSKAAEAAINAKLAELESLCKEVSSRHGWGSLCTGPAPARCRIAAVLCSGACPPAVKCS